MPRQEPLNDQQRRLLKIAARMSLASVANLAPVLCQATVLKVNRNG